MFTVRKEIYDWFDRVKMCLTEHDDVSLLSVVKKRNEFFFNNKDFFSEEDLSIWLHQNHQLQELINKKMDMISFYLKDRHKKQEVSVKYSKYLKNKRV